MREIIERLNHLIEVVRIRVKEFSEQEFSAQEPCKWSKKEILGHLCDSATNNQHRFIKIQLEKQPFVIIPYDQNKWVSVQGYQGIPTDEVVDLWATLNKHLVRVIAGIPEEKLVYQCDLGNHKIFTLSELVQDYLRHLDHHLLQIFGTTDI